MSLSQSHLAAIQQAGQALHHATQVIADSVRVQAQNIVALVASQPFQTDSEQALGQFRMLAQLNQDLQAMEVQLRGLYATAEELASPVMDVIGDQQRLTAHANTNAAVEDAVIKPARTSQKPSPARKSTRKPAQSSNATKVLGFLQSTLKPNVWTALTGSAIARGAKIPLGSVGVALSKVIASGAVTKGTRGLYRLSKT